MSIQELVWRPIAKTVSPYIHEMGIIPNHITLINIVLRVYIITQIYYKDYSLKTLLLLLFSNYLDVLDGTLARMYNETSEIGKLADEASDIVFWTIVMILTYQNFLKNKSVRLLLIFIYLTLILIKIQCNYHQNCKLVTIFEQQADIVVIIMYFMLTR